MSSEYLYNNPPGAGTTYALAGNRRTAVGTFASGAVSAIDYLADDGRGNITTAVTQGGAMDCTARYDPWGVPLRPVSSSNPCNTGATTNTAFYTGSRRDFITGDYQFGVRTYDPSTGSFLQPDTYFGSQPGVQGSVVTDPLTRNRYVYVNGDPLNMIDPSGHKTCRVGSANPDCDTYWSPDEPLYVDRNQPGGGAKKSDNPGPGKCALCSIPDLLGAWKRTAQGIQDRASDAGKRLRSVTSSDEVKSQAGRVLRSAGRLGQSPVVRGGEGFEDPVLLAAGFGMNVADNILNKGQSPGEAVTRAAMTTGAGAVGSLGGAALCVPEIGAGLLGTGPTLGSSDLVAVGLCATGLVSGTLGGTYVGDKYGEWLFRPQVPPNSWSDVPDPNAY